MYKDNLEKYDVIVIGGGASGMMAAGRAAERGKKVLLLEKNDHLGKKLLTTGGGRCNITNAEFDNRKLLEKFGETGKYLHSPFSKWSVKETLDFFHVRKLETKVENEQRVFPVTNKAEYVWQVLVDNLKKTNVKVISNSNVKNLLFENGLCSGVQMMNSEILKAGSYILATGGKSHPETGSTGDGFNWLKSVGHTIVEPEPVLVPVAIKDAWIKRVQGLTIQNIKLSVFQNGQKQKEQIGKVLFTHFGISGPTVLNISQEISELLKYGDVSLEIDLLPNLGHDIINTNLQKLLSEQNRKKLKNTLSDIIPTGLVPIIMEFSNINPDTFNSNVTRDARLSLISNIKRVMLEVKGLMGTDKAIVTSGGVVLDEVNLNTMQSKICPNLYLIGDILNINRPSGGYSLQLCWTTGHIAGSEV